MRYALYFTPPANSPLASLAAQWLGRDIHTPATIFADHSFSELLASPRRYGFHATMKAPFRLREGRTEAELLGAFTTFCRSQKSVFIDALTLEQIGPFFALIPQFQNDDLASLAAQCVRHFDPFRAPLTDDELARRNPEALTPEQRTLLAEWGYPFVFDEFRFHMTLTGPVPDGRVNETKSALQSRFAPLTGKPLAINSLSICVEPAPDQPFQILATHMLAQANTKEAAS